MIKGMRVNLRPIAEADLPLLRFWQSDPAVTAGWGFSDPVGTACGFTDDVTGRFATFETSGFFVIESGNNPVGRIDFARLDRRHGSCEIAIYIGEPGAIGHSFASDAVRALARHLFDQRDVHRIELTVIESNDRARRLYERVGFVAEGLLRNCIRFDGQWHNQLLMALFADGLTTETHQLGSL